MMSDQTPTNNTDKLRNLIESRHICDDEGFGCEIEEFKGSWPGANGVYFRCKLEKDDLANIEAYIHRYTQKMVLAELKQIMEKDKEIRNSGKISTPLLIIADRITTIERERGGL